MNYPIDYDIRKRMKELLDDIHDDLKQQRADKIFSRFNNKILKEVDLICKSNKEKE